MPEQLTNALDSDLSRPEANKLIRDALDVVWWFREWQRDEFTKNGRIEMNDAISHLEESLRHIVPEEAI